MHVSSNRHLSFKSYIHLEPCVYLPFFLDISSNKMKIPLQLWLMIARYLGEDALILSFALRDADLDLADAVYQIAEDHHLAAHEL